MSTHADKTQGNKNQSFAHEPVQQQRVDESSLQFADARPEPIAQKKLQALTDNSPGAMQLKSFQTMANNSPQTQQIAQLQAMVNHHAAQQPQPIQKKENNTGLPDDLKTGMENLSGMSLNHVKVHYNSSKPAAVQAHAYAQGSEIHLASGQEQHLPHELGHVVQQAQGRVQPTTSVGGVQVNDNPGLEAEATVMGDKAINSLSRATLATGGDMHQMKTAVSPNFIQRKIDSAPADWSPADKPGVAGYQAVAGLNSVTLEKLTATSKPEEIEDMGDPEIHKTIMDPSRMNKQRLTKMHLIRGRFGAPGDIENLMLGTALSNNFHDKSHYAQVEKPIADFISQDKGRRMVEYQVLPYGSPPAYFAKRLLKHPSAATFVNKMCPSVFICGVQFFKTDDDVNWKCSAKQIEHVPLDNGYENGGDDVP